MKYTKYVIYFFGIILPVITTAILIYKYGYHFPYWDEILYLPLYDKLSQGTLSITDLFFLQNNHRPFFPRIITLGLAKITSWNEFSILYSSLIFVIVQFLILAHIIISNNKEKLDYGQSGNSKNEKMKFLILCYVALLLFSWSQMENWVWGLQLMMFFTNLLCILVLFIMFKYQMNVLTLVVCTILTTMASYSFANGLLIWFTSLPLLIYKIAKTRKNYILLLIWILCAVAVISFYFTNYHTPSISKTNADTGLMHKFLYFILYISSPLSGFLFTPPWHGNKLPNINVISYLFGITGLVLWIFLLYKSKNIIVNNVHVCKFEKNKQILFEKRSLNANADEYFFWKSLSLFALFSGVLLAMGRSGMGLGQALSSRYITTGCLFWCSIMGLFNFYVKNTENPFKKYISSQYVKMILPIIIVILYFVLNFSTIYLNREWHQIARWKNLGWYALSSGYDGRLYWTDLWGDKDFIRPDILKNEILPIFKKYNLTNIKRFENEDVKKELAKIFIKEAKYFIKKELWKPAVCYLDTAIFLNPELPDIEDMKKQIPIEVFSLYEKYQNEWRLMTEKH